MEPQSPWRWGIVYYDRADARLLVPKRTGLGWTLNFGNRESWLVLGATVLAAALMGSIVALTVRSR